MDTAIIKELINYHKEIMEGSVRTMNEMTWGKNNLRIQYRTHERFVEELERQLKNG